MNILNNDKEIENVLNQDFVMIIAKSHTCSACKTILDMMKRSVPNIDQIDIYNIYVDDNDSFRGKHLIFSVPTVLIFSGGKELLRESRYINYDKITRLINLYKN